VETIAVPIVPPVELERAIVTTMTIVKVISNVEKTTATGQGTPALTPLTIVARETAHLFAQVNTSLSVDLMEKHTSTNVN